MMLSTVISTFASRGTFAKAPVPKPGFVGAGDCAAFAKTPAPDAPNDRG
jgi:hypothetical protein